MLRISLIARVCGVVALATTAPAVTPPAGLPAAPADAPGRWSVARANAWYATKPFLAGGNYLPSTAGNQLEMWQAETFDPATIDREFGFAQELGLNSMRVFLHDLLWREDSAGLLVRMERYLAIADRRGIRTLFVFFDSCWHPLPQSGPQPEPRPRTHNALWVQSPGLAVLQDPAKQAHLRPFVQGVIRHFAEDRRVLAWDIWNEPDNFDGAFPKRAAEPKNKADLVNPLLAAAFAWAREVQPSQPLTSAVWRQPGRLEVLDSTKRIQFAHSDVISFHCYESFDKFQAVVVSLKALGRPLLCTEYMTRPHANLDPYLGYMADKKIAAYFWGFVNGRSQTIYPVRSWRVEYTGEPNPWSNEILYPDGRPYRQAEADYIRRVMVR